VLVVVPVFGSEISGEIFLQGNRSLLIIKQTAINSIEGEQFCRICLRDFWDDADPLRIDGTVEEPLNPRAN